MKKRSRSRKRTKKNNLLYLSFIPFFLMNKRKFFLTKQPNVITAFESESILERFLDFDEGLQREGLDTQQKFGRDDPFPWEIIIKSYALSEKELLKVFEKTRKENIPEINYVPVISEAELNMKNAPYASPSVKRFQETSHGIPPCLTGYKN